jgi:hypothetical protein
MDFHSKTLRVLNRPKAARTEPMKNIHHSGRSAARTSLPLLWPAVGGSRSPRCSSTALEGEAPPAGPPLPGPRRRPSIQATRTAAQLSTRLIATQTTGNAITAASSEDRRTRAPTRRYRNTAAQPANQPGVRASQIEGCKCTPRAAPSVHPGGAAGARGGVLGSWPSWVRRCTDGRTGRPPAPPGPAGVNARRDLRWGWTDRS